MITPMIISFRECLEMLLVLVPFLVYLRKTDRLDLAKYIYGGGVLGVFTTFIAGGLVLGRIASLDGYAKEFFLGSMMLFMSGLILYNILWLGKQYKNISLDVNESYTTNLTGVSLFILSFLTIFRESLEIVMFLVPFINEPLSDIALGIAAGIVVSIIFGYLIFKTTVKLNINIVFSIITLTLIFIGGVLFAEGIFQIFPQFDEALELVVQLVFTIPLLTIFLIREIKRYFKK